MQVKDTELPPDVAYVLDCATEERMLSDAAHTVLQLFGDRVVIMNIVDEDTGSGVEGRYVKVNRFESYAYDLMRGAPENLRDGYVAVGLMGARSQAEDDASVLADWFFTDNTVGGSLEHFRKRWRCDFNYRPFPRTRRRLYAPSAIRRYVKRHDEMIPAARVRAQRFRSLPWPGSPTASQNLFGLYDQQREATRRRLLRIAHNAAWAYQQQKPVTRRQVRRSRKVVRRAFAFAVTILGAATVGAFANGQTIPIRGEQLTFHVGKATSVAQVGHGALDITVQTPAGDPLCKLCFFFDQTPALDQLAALAMYVDAGEELKVLNTGNVYAIQPAGLTHPLIKARAGDRLQLRRAPDIRDAVRAYTAETLPIFTDAALSAVWGPDKHRLIRWLAA